MSRILVIALILVGIAFLTPKLVRFAGQTTLPQIPLPSVKKENENLLPPDIVPIQPVELSIRNEKGKKVLRFSTTFYNQGKGALEFLGHTDRATNITYATQYVYEKDGAGEYRDIGEFVYHPAHSHWHVDKYVIYQLWSVTGENKTDKIIKSSDKMSFCILDERVYDLSMAGAPKTRVYSAACSGRQQGMSVGWKDTYKASFEGQSIDLEGVPDGKYIFRAMINPDKKILETNYDNDVIDTLIEIKGASVAKK